MRFRGGYRFGRKDDSPPGAPSFEGKAVPTSADSRSYRCEVPNGVSREVCFPARDMSLDPAHQSLYRFRLNIEHLGLRGRRPFELESDAEAADPNITEL